MKRNFDISRLRKLVAAGLSQRDIARTMGYHVNTIQVQARKHNIGNNGTGGK